MPIFKLEVSREVTYWETAVVEVDASSLEEAKENALEEAHDGFLEFDTDEFPKVHYEIFEEEDD